ncbi:nuclear receptor coactivator 7 isoform X1 [Erpetoichthys calabaricus]|uniref:nuclear receptor coactivator 7 isoform X1 n=1 Tax=Erpetoichthys calabaricus TaxID=27687 RepID=UPI00223439A9|nr:nuclear receptor coactivator 7 isoform X1 [Erpetoichthys calabaricus]
MDLESQRQRRSRSYFSNVKTRLGSKLHPAIQSTSRTSSHLGWAQSNQQGRAPWWAPLEEPQSDPDSFSGTPRTRLIRNPQLRKYYLMESIPLQDDPGSKGVVREQPVGTKEYLVGAQDTLFSVASQFDTTPNQLVKLNKLYSQTLLPGQRLYVPDFQQKTLSSAPDISCSDNPLPSQPSSPQTPSPDSEYDKLLDVETVTMPDGQLCLLALPPECDPFQGEDTRPVRYLKLCCRYITDRKGVVSGILLVTPNKIFFDPYKSHPLVIEHGCEDYLLSCAIDTIVSVAFFNDISMVHFGGKSKQSCKKKEVHKPKVPTSEDDKVQVPKLETKPVPPMDNNQPASSNASGTHIDLDARLSYSLSLKDPDFSKQPLASQEEMKGTFGQDNRLDGATQVMEKAGKDISTHVAEGMAVGVLSSAASFCCGGLKSLEEVNGNEMKPIQERNEKRVWSDQGTQRALPQEPPNHGVLMFVRLRFQASTKKSFTQPKNVGKLQTQDAWLIFSQERSDELYAYLSHWRPDLCIMERDEEVEEMEEDDEDEEEEEEFVLVEQKDDVCCGENQLCRKGNEEWEIISVEDGSIKHFEDKEPVSLSEILEKTSILEESHIHALSHHLPSRMVVHHWHLAYSTSVDGSSLRTLYRKVSQRDSPCLLVLKDFHNEIFGGFVSHPFKYSDLFYGTGETFLFTFYPEFKCFHWTGENSFFIKGDLDSIAIGGGGGRFGLWLDKNLYLGHSSRCATFNNAILAEKADFRVLELEVWMFS